MTAEEWERIKSIFDAVRNLAEADRSRYLELSCSPEMREIIEELVAGDKSAEAREFLPDGPSWRQRVFSDGALVANRFRIVRFIACGGMGEVYEAFDERLRLRIAIKTLRPELSIDADAIDRFEREIRIARGVAQANLCRVYDFVEHRFPDAPDRCVPCLTMQLLEGESLRERLQRERPLSAGTALPLIRQIAAALDCLHQNGIVHRDLKPSNIMLVPGESDEIRAVVTDFGLAKLTSADEIFESRTRFHVGAPFFMAPEILRGQRPGPASDIYALGLLIDEMVTRSSAFTATSLQALYYSKLWEKPIPTEQRSDGLPGHWSAAIAKCIELDPQARYSRASDVVTGLQTERPSRLLSLPARVYKTVTATIARKTVVLGIVASPLLLGALAARGILTRAAPPGVVVFPFENLSADASLNSFCRGVTAELLTELNQTRDLHTYTGTARGAKNSSGRFALEGNMRSYRGQLRLTVSLTDTKDTSIVWSQAFEGSNIESTLQLEREIAFDTVSQVRSRVISESADSNAVLRGGGLLFNGAFKALGQVTARWSAPPRPTESAEAFNLYFRGRYLWDQRSLPETLKALNLFQQAIQLDGHFARAYSAMADAQLVLMDYNYAPFPVLIQRAENYAQQAIDLGPDVAESYASMAAIQQAKWDWAGSQANYLKALQLSPKFARAMRWHAGLLLQMGSFDAAIGESRDALNLDPYDFASASAHGLYLFYAGRLREAQAQLEQVLAQKDMLYAHQNLGDVYAILATAGSSGANNDYMSRALSEAAKVAATESAVSGAVGMPPSSAMSDRMYASYYGLMGSTARAGLYVRKMEQRQQQGGESPVSLAWVYTCTGDTSRALAQLQSAAAYRDRKLQYVKLNPFFNPLHEMAGYRQVIASMGL